jgi:CRISPR-associated protein Cas2
VFVIVCYDIGNVDGPGRIRLRRAAEACLDHGVRVQYSVFECRISEAQWVLLKARLLEICELSVDSLRFYSLCETDERRIEVYGRPRGADPTGPLVV